MVTSASSWKKSRPEIELPSGNTAQLRRVGIDVFLKTGRVPNTLLPMMRGALAGKAIDLASVDITEQMVTDIMSLQDMIAVEAFIDPKVLPLPKEGAERDEDALYVDDIDFEDKQFILQWTLGGTSDVAKFRHQTAEQLEAVRAKQGLGQAPE